MGTGGMGPHQARGLAWLLLPNPGLRGHMGPPQHWLLAEMAHPPHPPWGPCPTPSRPLRPSAVPCSGQHLHHVSPSLTSPAPCPAPSPHVPRPPSGQHLLTPAGPRASQHRQVSLVGLSEKTLQRHLSPKALWSTGHWQTAVIWPLGLCPPQPQGGSQISAKLRPQI